MLGDFVAVTVADTGIGMTHAEVEIALKPFGQVDSGHTREYEGTGLGLPISKAIVELHDGSRIVLRKVAEDYDPTDRASATAGLQQAQAAGAGRAGRRRPRPQPR